MPLPDASVVIAFGSLHRDLLHRQLDQLRRQRTGRSYEVIVSDNAGVLDAVARDDVRVVNSSGRVGAGHARNVGVAHAQAPLLLFCDADDLVGPEWIESHCTALAVGPFTTGSLLKLSEDDARIVDIVNGHAWPASSLFSDVHRFHEGVPYAISANCGIRRDIFETVGGFPESYLRAQDVAMSLGLREMGIEPTFVPEAQVVKCATGGDGGAALLRAYRSGRSKAQMSFDYDVGPSSAQLVKRHASRAVRSRQAVMFSRSVVQLTGIIDGLTRLKIRDLRSSRQHAAVTSGGNPRPGAPTTTSPHPLPQGLDCPDRGRRLPKTSELA